MTNLIKSRLLLPALLLLALAVAGCGLFGGDFEETFDNPSAWGIRNVEYVTTEVVDGRFLMRVDFPDSLFWTTAGRRNLADGRFEVTVEPVAGSVESAYGLVLRASPGGNDFYYFLISADGYYSTGGCLDGCINAEALIPLGDFMWTLAPQLATGLNTPHTLAVDAIGRELVFYVDGQELARHQDDRLTQGDIGLMLQTFDSAATVAFDDLRFIPQPQE